MDGDAARAGTMGGVMAEGIQLSCHREIREVRPLRMPSPLLRGQLATLSAEANVNYAVSIKADILHRGRAAWDRRLRTGPAGSRRSQAAADPALCGGDGQRAQGRAAGACGRCFQLAA